MRSGRYAVLSESRISPLRQVNPSPRPVSPSVPSQLPRKDLSPKVGASVSDFHVSSGYGRTSLWNRQALRTSWPTCIGNSSNVTRTLEALTVVILSILRPLTLRWMTSGRTSLIEYDWFFQSPPSYPGFLGRLTPYRLSGM